jgi:sarcosine oxidase subunit beta
MPDVIVIGAGVIGTSIAYHLAKNGCRDVVVLEKEYIGSGSTEKCPGGIRQQFATEANIRLSMESVRLLENFEEETGYIADFRQYGYLILATSKAELNTFRRNIKLQRKLGLEVELLSPEEVGKLVPGLNLDDILGASFCASDGYADPYSVVAGFASASRRLGVKIYEETEVTGIKLVKGRVRGVRTTKGGFTTAVVVDAAGPYAGVITAMTGIYIPLQPSRRHIFITEPEYDEDGSLSSLGRPDLPMVVDFHNGFWFRREGACLIFGMRNPDEPGGFDSSVDWGFFSGTLSKAACHRLPALYNTGIARGQAGLHSDTPDNNAILGETPGVTGLFLACGFSGHGFMHAPAVGRLIADLVMKRKSAIKEAYPFRLDRFRHPLQVKETVFI